jgi:integrase
MKGSMKGSIIKQSRYKQSYTIVLFLGYDDKGKKKYKWVTVQGTKHDAQVKLAELRTQLNTGTYVDPKGTLGEFLKRWLVEYARPNLSPRTYEGYESIIRAHITPVIGNTLIKNLKPEHIQKYYADRLADGSSTTTVRHHAMLLHCALEHALKWQLLVRNPADAVTPPRIRHIEMHVLDETQVGIALSEAKNTPYYALFYLAVYTGMRQSELLALRWGDIDLTMAELSVSRSMHRLLTHEVVFRGTKTAKSSRTVALSPNTCQVMRQHLDNEMALCNRLGIPFTNDRLVFCIPDGKPLIPATVRQAWRRLIKRLGYPNIRFHDLRHTHASLMLKQGIHPKIVQERLGHATISTTLDLYSHVTPGLQRKAVEAFDEIFKSRLVKD